MPADLHWVIDRDSPYALLRLAGMLDVASAATVRSALGKCLAAQPTAIVVDIAELHIRTVNSLGVFALAAQQAARWPGSPLLLCCPKSEVADVLRRTPILRYVPVVPDLEAALASIGQEPAPHRLHTHLQPASGAARQARELVTEACARWDVPELVGPACTVITELVNNVVVHAGTPMDVVVQRRRRHLNISVRDESPDPPDARGPAFPTAPGGRGLLMVDAVAQHWGYAPTERGKVVWAVLPITERPASSRDSA